MINKIVEKASDLSQTMLSILRNLLEMIRFISLKNVFFLYELGRFVYIPEVKPYHLLLYLTKMLQSSRNISIT